MGTETQRLQQQIKALIARLGWSQKVLAGELWSMENDEEFPRNTDVAPFAERLKKYLTRSSTPPELLRHYLQLIQQHERFRQLDQVVPQYVPTGGFSDAFIEGMRTISFKLDEGLVDPAYDDPQHEG